MHSSCANLRLFSEYDVDFEDALSVAHMEQDGIETILSYDRDFDLFPGIARAEP